MEMTLGKPVTLETLPKPGETVRFEGYISEHAPETLNIAMIRTAAGSDIAAWAKVSIFDTEAVIVIDEKPRAFQLSPSKTLVGGRSRKASGIFQVSMD